MNTLESIQQGLKKSKAGRARRVNNFYNSPAYPGKLIQLFCSTFREQNFGEPPPISSQVKNMLNGFIRVCRSSNWNERKIYTTIKDLVLHWDYIKKQNHSTIKTGKRAMLGDRPSLLEFLICRESVLTAIDQARRSNILEPSGKEIKNVLLKKRRRYTPSEAEMQAEYEKQMEDM
jgi:hypothetical protein